MSAGTKVTIAIVVLFAAVLGVYYGFGGPGAKPVAGSDQLPPAETAAAAALPEAPLTAGPGPESSGPLATAIQRALNSQAAPGEESVGAPSQAESGGVTRGGEPAEPAGDVWVLRAPTIPAVREPGGQARPGQTGSPVFVDYTVREDDSLWTIAQRWFGDPTRWRSIAQANPSIDPNRLRVGQRLRLPDIPSGKRIRLNHSAAIASAPKPDSPGSRTPSPAPARAGVQYAVEAGDTLSKIAQFYYRDAARWQMIYQANRSAIGWDPDRLKVGMRLRIPGVGPPG